MHNHHPRLDSYENLDSKGSTELLLMQSFTHLHINCAIDFGCSFIFLFYLFLASKEFIIVILRDIGVCTNAKS